MDRTISGRTLDRRQPFTREAALKDGLTDRELRGPLFRRLFRDCFISAAAPLSEATRVRGALLVTPKARFATRFSAARLLGGIVPDTPETHLGVVGSSRSRRDGIAVHQYSEKPALVRRGEAWTTTAERTFVDLAADLTLVDLVILGDSLVKKGRTTAEDLVASAAAWKGRAARAARTAASLVRHGVDSPQETRTRLLIVLAGLPEPTVNVPIRAEDGRVVRRLDLGYEDAKLAIEYDGRQHIEREDHWEADIGRREDIENDGWRFVILISKDIFVTPAETLDRIVRAMTAAGMRVPPLKDDWRRHFPGRPQAA